MDTEIERIAGLGEEVAEVVRGLGLAGNEIPFRNPCRTGSAAFEVVHVFGLLWGAGLTRHCRRPEVRDCDPAAVTVTAAEVRVGIALRGLLRPPPSESAIGKILRKAFGDRLRRTAAFGLISSPSSTPTSEPSAGGLFAGSESDAPTT